MNLKNELYESQTDFKVSILFSKSFLIAFWYIKIVFIEVSSRIGVEKT